MTRFENPIHLVLFSLLSTAAIENHDLLSFTRFDPRTILPAVDAVGKSSTLRVLRRYPGL